MFQEGLFEKLTEYSESGAYGFHMPGHKRNVSFPGALDYYGIDITEIRDFDDLHHPDGILKEAQELAADLFHSEETHFLVNGSTVGILSSILAATERGDQILVARNCHKSVYHAIYMNELRPVFLYPEYDEATQLNKEMKPEMVKAMLEEYPGIKAVVLVSPTYDGVVSDIRAIADLVHEKGIPLIVDEAHGAHFGFHPYFPENSCSLGADLVIHSLHKTLPSPTQTALLHMNGDLVDREQVRMYLHMLQSSSPSYVLMAGIDRCIRILNQDKELLFEQYVQRLQTAREELEGLKKLRIVKTEQFDRSKIVISVAGASISSKELAERLWELDRLEFEMRAGSYLLAMTSVCDTTEGLDRLVDALFRIDEELQEEEKNLSVFRIPRCQSVCRISEALKEKRKFGVNKAWEESVGQVSAEYAYVYPPGIPLIVPGEIISPEVVDMLQWYQNNDFQVEGMKKEGSFVVLWEKYFI